MKLFERVDHLCEINRMSRRQLALRLLPDKHNTVIKWFTAKSEKNLYPYLETILGVFPGTNPEWLYRGLGEPTLAGRDLWLEGGEAGLQELKEELDRKTGKLDQLEVDHKNALTRLADCALELAQVRGEFIEYLKVDAGKPAKRGPK